MSSNLFTPMFGGDSEAKVTWMYNSTGQTIASSTFTQITFDRSEMDTDSGADLTNNRFKPSKRGYYHLVYVLDLPQLITQLNVAYIYKNGAMINEARSNSGRTGDGISTIVSTVAYLDGIDDYITAYAYQNSGSSATTPSGATRTYLQAMYLGE